MKVSQEQFKKVYFEAISDILAVRPIDDDLKIFLSKNENTYLTYDFEEYLKRSWKRCWNVYNLLPEIEDSPVNILDVGGFFGNFSLCLKRLGYGVSLAEAYDYYGGHFDGLKEFLVKEGVSVGNYDFSKLVDNSGKRYDVVLCLAVLEHFAHSPKIFMENIKKFIGVSGLLILEIPNIAYWPKRYKLLKGQTILSSIDTIYKSEEPFMGHHHEYAANEVGILADLSGLEVKKMIYFNYSMVNSFKNVLNNLPVFLFDKCKEDIMAVLAPKQV